MSMEYIQNGDKLLGVATKLKLLEPVEDNLINPFEILIITPDQSEALNSGGGFYEFIKVLGLKAAVRRLTTPKQTHVEYDGELDTEVITLTVTKPFESLHYPYNEQDTLVLDGLNIPVRLAGKIKATLSKAKRLAMRSLVINNQKAKLGQGAGTDVLAELLEIRLWLANWLDLTIDNDFWSKEMKYFDGLEGYSLDPVVFMNPRDIVDFSTVNTIAGAGTIPQFLEFKDGTLKSIIGFKVISTPLVPAGKIYPTIKTIGTPDPKIMTEKIIDYYDRTTDVNLVWGKKYFDGVNIWGDLCGIFTRTPISKRKILTADEMKAKTKEAMQVIISDDTAKIIGEAMANALKLKEAEATNEQITTALETKAGDTPEVNLGDTPKTNIEDAPKTNTGNTNT